MLVCGTRYGNVIASRGSVIPLFIQQIKAGKPLTITDPDMTRFIMSLENAVDLVLYAFEKARPGDIFVQKAPACTIGDLAQALLEMFGARNEVKVIGTRHGEKRYETLLNREEMARAEDLGDYFRIPADTRDLNYAKYFVTGEQRISERGDYDSDNTTRLGVKEIRDLLSRRPLREGRTGPVSKVLVTGSEGFLGKNLAVALRRLPGVEVLSFDRERDHGRPGAVRCRRPTRSSTSPA